MQTTAFNRPQISSRQNGTADDANKTDARSRDATMKGNEHLLEGTTLEDALGQNCFDPS
jgi:hypothetical protein